MKIKFEHDYQQKIMLQAFEEPVEIATAKDVQIWRSRWMQELKSWHSPYKTIIDASHLKVSNSDDVKAALSLMSKFFEGLFLKSAVAYAPHKDELSLVLPFEVVTTFEEAQVKAGVRGMRSPTAPADFRATIQFQNHFAQHVVEMSFTDEAVIDSKEKMATLKSKLTNNLMQWHSKWSLLIDCSNLKFSGDHKQDWEKLQTFLSGFFMKACVGYGSNESKETFPFAMYRSRHKAVAMLEAEGNFMGNDAHCRSAKPSK
jgi:hypothetical protein